MSPIAPALKEVLDTHVAIQQWLSGDAAADQLDPLMARFSPHYSMITLPGHRLDYPGMYRLFQQAYGKRPGLQIRIDELQEIASHSCLTVVSYREWQADAVGNQSLRRATAVFEHDHGTLRWRHLHETPVAS
ncbi:hypothetical protein D3C77_378550 [compost metagenome]